MTTTEHEDDEEPVEEDEPVRDPVAYNRSRSESKYRVRAKQAEEERDAHRARADAAEGALLTAAVEVAFVRAAVAAGVTDVEAAWRLADLDDVTLDEDGVIVGADEAVDALKARYPYLVVGAAPAPERTQPPSASTSGKKMNGQKKTNPGLDRAALAKRFPALRTR